jgi:uncharacterized membrane protein
MAPSPADDLGENTLVKLVSIAIVGVGLLALFTGQNWFWMVFALGFAVLVPIVKLVSDEFDVGVGTNRSGGTESERTTPESKQDELDTLRDRYARGELTEAEFERKVETLLETETLEGARERVDRVGDGREDRDAAERERR